MERKYYTGGEGKPLIWIQPIIEKGKMFDLDFFHFTETDAFYMPDVWHWSMESHIITQS